MRFIEDDEPTITLAGTLEPLEQWLKKHQEITDGCTIIVEHDGLTSNSIPGMVKYQRSNNYDHRRFIAQPEKMPQITKIDLIKDELIGKIRGRFEHWDKPNPLKEFTLKASKLSTNTYLVIDNISEQQVKDYLTNRDARGLF